MDTEHIEQLLKSALERKEVDFELSEQRKALVLSVPSNKAELVELLDDVFCLGMASLIPLNKRGKVEAMPIFHTDRYTVSPALNGKRKIKGGYLYGFIYTPKQ